MGRGRGKLACANQRLPLPVDATVEHAAGGSAAGQAHRGYWRRMETGSHKRTARFEFNSTKSHVPCRAPVSTPALRMPLVAALHTSS